MLESFPANSIFIATKMANDKIRELRTNYKPIQINSIREGTDSEPTYSIVVLFEAKDRL